MQTLHNPSKLGHTYTNTLEKDVIKWKHYQPELILLTVRWYLRYNLSLRKKWVNYDKFNNIKVSNVN
ncbi:hypothetical protein CN445_16365 [Bacillus cereus]|nr:hypothetical protein CN445_16365 [Bacillus cereus]PFN67399.1 hypothetical protein COJ62_23355 [Bacillus cereus]